MRRRLFWAIVGVAAVTGLLVLAGAVIASQRAAVEATYREMSQSAREAVAIIEETAQRAEANPAAGRELIRVFEGELSPTFGRIRRTAGSSEIGFGIVSANGAVRSNSSLFDSVPLNEDLLEEGKTQFARSEDGALIVVARAQVPQGGTLLVALSREAPVVRLADQSVGLILVVSGVGLLAAIAARVQANKVASRLEPLAVASRELAEGDMGARVPDLGDPELDEVAGAFNEMAVELERTREREREFILGVGHDLRTPLTTIGGYAEALEAGDVDPADLSRVGSVLGVQSRQLSRLIEDLSMLARLEQPEFSLRTEQVNVGAHVGEIVESFRRKADDAGVRLVIDTEGSVIVETDPDRLGQITQNLLENALRFTPEAGTVSVNVTRDGTNATLTVSDSGLGISAEDLPHVFDRHYVGTQRQLRNEGSGLGLSIVAGLVDRLGGTVEAESEVGKGTMFRVQLPG